MTFFSQYLGSIRRIGWDEAFNTWELVNGNFYESALAANSSISINQIYFLAANLSILSQKMLQNEFPSNTAKKGENTIHQKKWSSSNRIIFGSCHKTRGGYSRYFIQSATFKKLNKDWHCMTLYCVLSVLSGND